MNATEEIKVPCVVICHFLTDEKVQGIPGSRIIYYQVTIDPHNHQQLSPDNTFIRFGAVKGDEIMGWQPCMNIVIDETLMVYDNPEEIPYINQIKVSTTLTVDEEVLDCA